MSEGTPEQLKKIVKANLVAKQPTKTQTAAMGTLASNGPQIAQLTQSAQSTPTKQSRTVKLAGHGPKLKEWVQRFAKYADVEPAFEAARTWDDFDGFMKQLNQHLEATPMGQDPKKRVTEKLTEFLQGRAGDAEASTGPTWKVTTDTPLVQSKPKQAQAGPSLPLQLQVIDSARKHRLDLRDGFKAAGLPTPDELVAWIDDGARGAFGYVDDPKYPHFAYEVGQFMTKGQGGWPSLKPWSILIAPDGRIFHYGPTGTSVSY
jgi:hypothetical protein